MAIHSSILSWKLLWTEDPRGYSPWGCKESDRSDLVRRQGDDTQHFSISANIVLFVAYFWNCVTCTQSKFTIFSIFKCRVLWH